MTQNGSLLERDRELASLESLIDGAAEGRARLALVEGPVGEALTGSASDGDGHQREFCGWLGLVSAIEALISPTPQEDLQKVS